MAFLIHKKQKYLMLLPILFLIFNAVFFRFLTNEIQNALLMEKYDEVVNHVNVLSAAADFEAENEWTIAEDNIRVAVEFIDRLYQVYAGAYKLCGNELELITERFYETSIFEPLDYAEFCDTVFTAETGYIVIGYTPEGQTYRELHLYFKWMPSNINSEERYLVVAGISDYSVTVTISEWISISQWVSMGVTFIIHTALITILVRFSHIYRKHNRDKPQGEILNG